MQITYWQLSSGHHHPCLYDRCPRDGPLIHRCIQTGVNSAVQRFCFCFCARPTCVLTGRPSKVCFFFLARLGKYSGLFCPQSGLTWRRLQLPTRCAIILWLGGKVSFLRLFTSHTCLVEWHFCLEQWRWISSNAESRNVHKTTCQ